MILILGIWLIKPVPQGVSLPAYPIAGDTVQPLLQKGDIILRMGKSTVSRLIVSALQGDLEISHCALYLPEEEAVIHSVSQSLSDFDGVQKENYSQFSLNSRPGTTIIVRPLLSMEEREEFVQKVLTAYENKIPFDNYFQMNNGETYYCSELFYHSLPERFQKGSFIFQEPQGVIKFESFLNPEYFETIVDFRPQ